MAPRSRPQVRRLLLLLAAAAAAPSRAMLLAASTLEACVQSGAGSSAGGASSGLSCAQRFVVTLAVQNAQRATESIVTYALSSATDAAGLTYDVLDTVELTLSKSAIELLYPLSYVRTVNNAPYELDLGGNGAGAFNFVSNSCVDDPSAEGACGWALDGSGARIAASNGFCCRCSAGDFLGGGGGASLSRNGLACNLFQSASSQAANCLRFDPLWYAAFAVGAPQTAYTIDIAMQRCRAAASANASGSPTCVWDVLTLSPSVPAACLRFTPLPGLAASASASASPAIGCSVQATLVGDFAAFASAPDLSSSYVYAPVQCDDWAACGARLLENASRWLLLGRELAHFGGDVCNVIGVSYAAFQAQGSRCAVPAGSCLGGQLQSYYAAAAAADAAGAAAADSAAAVFLRNAGGAGAPYVLANVGAAASARLTLGTAAYQQSVVTLVLDAAALRWVQRVARGVITAVEAPTSAAMAAGGGTLAVSVLSTGAVRALFTVTVACASEALLAFPAQALTLDAPPAAAAAATCRFAVQAATLSAGAYACTVRLLDGLGAVTDTRAVVINMTATALDKGAQGGSAAPTPTGVGAGGNASATAATGCDACRAWDLLCAARNLCVPALGGWAGAALGVLGALAAYAFLAAKCPSVACAPCRILLAAASGCGGSPAAPQRRRSEGSRSPPARRGGRRGRRDSAGSERAAEAEADVEASTAAALSAALLRLIMGGGGEQGKALSPRGDAASVGEAAPAASAPTSLESARSAGGDPAEASPSTVSSASVASLGSPAARTRHGEAAASPATASAAAVVALASPAPRTRNGGGTTTNPLFTHGQRRGGQVGLAPAVTQAAAAAASER